MVGGSGLVSGLVLGVLSNTFVFNIGNISVSVSGIGHNLDTAVGKVDSVRSLGVVTVTGFAGFKVSFGVIIGNTVLELVLGRDIGVSGFMVSSGFISGSGLVGGGTIRRSLVSNGNAGNKGKDSELKKGLF